MGFQKERAEIKFTQHEKEIKHGINRKSNRKHKPRMRLQMPNDTPTTRLIQQVGHRRPERGGGVHQVLLPAQEADHVHHAHLPHAPTRGAARDGGAG